VQRLKEPHLGPIDVPISHSVMSFVVQQYFCFRIWTLDKRLLMLCIIISMVRGRLQVLPFPSPLTRYFASSFQYFNHPCRCGAGSRQDSTTLLKCLTLNAFVALVSYTQAVHCLEDKSICTMPSFHSSHRNADTLLHQLWVIPSAVADILIATAMILLVRAPSPPLSFFDASD
jgi:hypothetical protein